MDIWNNFPGVNRKLLPVKCHYFLFMAGLASALPFRTVFAKQLGISATAVGVIFCAVPFFKVVSNSLCGFVIDYFKRFRLTISVVMIVVALTHVAMIFIPPLTVKNNGSIHFNKKLFHSRLVYSCVNETLAGSESRHNVEFYTYYSQLQYPLNQTGKLICDMECSNLRKDDLQQKPKNKQECEKGLTFEFTIYATFSNSNVDIKLQDGKIFSGNVDLPNISKFNESSITSFECWSSFSDGNCSSELKESNIINLTRFDHGIEGEINHPSSDELDINEDSSGISKNTSRETRTYLKSEKKSQYYTLYKYAIKSQSAVCNYSLEYDCFIKQCSSNISKTEDDLEHLNARGNEFLSLQFWILFILIALSSIAFSAIMLTMDTVCYEMLQEKKGNYGHQRLWGSVGWGLGALAGGYLNEIISPDSSYIDYSPGFYLLALLTIVDLIPIYHLEVTDVKYSSHIWKDVCFLLSKANIVYNIVVVFFIGILSGFIWNYQFWFMEEIGASQVLLGLSQTFECMFEILCFLASGWIIRKIGHANSNNVTFLCFGLRYLAFAFMHNAWLTLPVGILHGPTFGLFYASMTMYAKEQAPPGTEATVQSLLHSCFEGLGVAVGSILGGIGIDNFGSRSAFMYTGSFLCVLLDQIGQQAKSLLMEKFKVNKKLLIVKAHYFLLNAAHSGVITFIPVYAVQLGISASAIGIIIAALSCLTVVSRTAFGGIVDHFQKLKQVILFLILVDAVADLGLNFIPRPYQAPLNITREKLFCYGGNSYFLGKEKFDYEFQPGNFTDDYSIRCFLCQRESVFCFENNDTNLKLQSLEEVININFSDKNLSAISFKKCLQNKDVKCSESCFDGSEKCENISGTNPPLQLWLLSLFVGLIYMANGSIVSLSDAACYNALGDQPQNFGRQRMWGTIGWGLFAFLTGYLNQIFTGSSKVYSFSSGFYILIALFVVDLIVITKLDLENVSISKNICKDVGNLIVKPRILLFILGMFGIGILTGISRSYLYWYLRTTLGASQLLLGCLSGIQCFFGELPFFFFSGLIIKKLGHINTFTMSFLAYGVRFLCHSFLRNPWWSVAIEFLQGPCFGSFYSAMTSYSKLISPKGTEATMQGIVSGTFEGLGVATGSLLCGFCFSNFGGRTTFYWTGVLSLIIGVIHWLIYFILNGKKKFTIQR